MLTSPALEDVSWKAFKRDLQGYSRETFWQDLFAGFSVALLTVPQAMAFALVAGLPLSCGLLASIFPAIIAALFGSSRHLIVGSNNAVAILVQYGTAEVLYTFYRGVTGTQRELLALQILTQIGFLVGIFQVAAAFFKLGRLTQFVSHTVVVGYLVGTAMGVVINQLLVFLGLPSPIEAYSLYEKGVFLISHLSSIHWPTAIVGGISLTFLIIFKKLHRNLPASAIMLIVMGILVHFLGLSSYSHSGMLSSYLTTSPDAVIVSVGDKGEVQNIVPSVHLPFFNAGVLNLILPISFAIALLTILETTSVAKSLTSSTGQKFSVNQEIFGLGLANLVGSLICALPCCGSPSRSAVNMRDGARTRFAAVYSAFCVGIIVVVFHYFVSRTPLAALSAILLVSAMNIVNIKHFFLCLKATKSDAMVLMATVFACIFFSFDIAFYTGIILSITSYLKKAAIPHLVECTFDESGRIGSLDVAKKHEHRLIRVINVQGELFFGAADLFQTALKSIAEDDVSTKAIIIRLKNARDIDATVCLTLQQLHQHLKNSGRFLIACGLSYQNWRVLCDSGIVDEIGKDNLFILDEKFPHQSMQKALRRAKELIHENERLSLSPSQTETVVLSPSYQQISS